MIPSVTEMRECLVACVLCWWKYFTKWKHCMGVLAQASITKYQGHLFVSHSSGGRGIQDQDACWFSSCESSLPGLQMTAVFLCFHMAFPCACIFLSSSSFLFYFQILYLFIWESEHMSRGERQREKQNPCWAGSPTQGLYPRTLRSWPQSKADAWLPE